MTETPTLRQRSILMDAMFGLTIAALFSGIHEQVGSVKVQLSDVLAIASIFLGMLRGFATPRLSAMMLLTIIAYYLLYSLSALFVQLSMGITKITQIFLVFSFLFVAFGYYRTRSTDRVLIIAATLMLLVLCVNVGWHVARGQYVGWKQLNEPKTIFTLMPLLLILLFTRFGDRWKQPLPLLAVTAAGLIIFLSGERKAYIFAVVALVVWSGPAKIWRYAIVAALAVPLLWVAASADRTGYLHRQLATLQEPTSETNLRDVSVAQLLDERRPTTLSNAEREYTNRVARSMWKQEPLLGIGTNAFELAIKDDLSVPALFRMGIHGGFYRALYENGIFGLALYISLWVVALACLFVTWQSERGSGDSPLRKIKLLAVIMLLIYVSFESDKGLTVYAICILPFLVALAPRSPLADFGASSVHHRPERLTFHWPDAS
jgi:hypothetical protein